MCAGTLRPVLSARHLARGAAGGRTGRLSPRESGPSGFHNQTRGLRTPGDRRFQFKLGRPGALNPDPRLPRDLHYRCCPPARSRRGPRRFPASCRSAGLAPGSPTRGGAVGAAWARHLRRERRAESWRACFPFPPAPRSPGGGRAVRGSPGALTRAQQPRQGRRHGAEAADVVLERLLLPPRPARRRTAACRPGGGPARARPGPRGVPACRPRDARGAQPGWARPRPAQCPWADGPMGSR